MKRSLLFVVLAGLALGPALSQAADPAPTTAQANTSGDDQQATLLNDYLDTIKLNNGLEVYNKQLARQLDDQKRIMDELNTSIDNTEYTRRQLVPLLQQMINTLATFVDLDLPFELDIRHARIAKLREHMNRPDLSIAEKFKEVLDAYQKELDYGSDYQTYSQYIEVNGRHREVDILRWGRLTLAFQTPDQETTGVWDNKNHKWVVLSDKYRDGIRKAFRIARGITSKNFVILPVPPAVQESQVDSASAN
ncbi:MAG TPA: DUF3450 domain-containing protein [Pseudomonadales bacterium]|nr:DUF3450 domain-containing protein [Pseudomonadales bacterium]